MRCILKKEQQRRKMKTMKNKNATSSNTNSVKKSFLDQISTKNLVTTAILAALIIIFGAVIGTIPIGPVGLTLMHIPVIIGAIVLGWKYGVFLGFIMGLVSCLIATFLPFTGAFIFSPFIPLPGSDHGSILALVVCFVPRMLIGVLSPLSFEFLKKKFAKKHPAYGISAVIGSLTNTLLVILFIAIFFSKGFLSIQPAGRGVFIALLLMVLLNGLPEALVSFLVVFATGSALTAIESRDSKLVSSATESITAKNDELLNSNENLKQNLGQLEVENDLLRQHVLETSLESAPVASEDESSELEGTHESEENIKDENKA